MPTNFARRTEHLSRESCVHATLTRSDGAKEDNRAVTTAAVPTLILPALRYFRCTLDTNHHVEQRQYHAATPTTGCSPTTHLRDRCTGTGGDLRQAQEEAGLRQAEAEQQGQEQAQGPRRERGHTVPSEPGSLGPGTQGRTGTQTGRRRSSQPRARGVTMAPVPRRIQWEAVGRRAVLLQAWAAAARRWAARAASSVRALHSQ